LPPVQPPVQAPRIWSAARAEAAVTMICRRIGGPFCQAAAHAGGRSGVPEGERFRHFLLRP
jgi:hypothetical protein